jgi:hypothetical protein
MISQEFLSYDRGKLLLWPLQFFSWLFPFLFLVLWLDFCPFFGTLLVFGVVVCSKIYMMLVTCFFHFWLANVVADGLRADVKAAMRKTGIRFRLTPRPPRLFALPCKYMVLSTIMMSMWSVAMAGHLRPPLDGEGDADENADAQSDEKGVSSEDDPSP